MRIFSFSFHQGGPPRDESGNGGGFVFDVRSVPNPGREERFKNLTGKDAAVIDYLQQQPSAHQYLASVMSLVETSVNEYQQRGFKNLMVSFGCTGGQHRSVYFAEQLASDCATVGAWTWCCGMCNWKNSGWIKCMRRTPPSESHDSGRRFGHSLRPLTNELRKRW